MLAPLALAVFTLVAATEKLPVRSPKSVGMSAERLATISRVVRRGVDAGGVGGTRWAARLGDRIELGRPRRRRDGPAGLDVRYLSVERDQSPCDTNIGDGASAGTRRAACAGAVRL